MISIAAAVVLIDQISKLVVVAWIGPDEVVQRRELAGAWLAFEYVENTGAAFGIMAGRVWLLSILALIVGLGFVVAFRRELPSSPLLRSSIGLVVGGGLGNLIDRLRLGHVIDFIAVGVWPKFNVADSAITIGLVLLALAAFREEPPGETST
jgi:signal peptidase II